MSSTRRALPLVLIALLAPTAAAYGTLDVMPALRPEVDHWMQFFVYGFYGQRPLDPVLADHHYKVGWEDGDRSAFVYHDADDDYRHDADEIRSPQVTAQAHGNATDHAYVVLPAGLRAQLCPGRAADGVDGGARGLRCGGDLDRDGDGDVEEALLLRVPVMAGPDDGLRPFLPLLP